MNNDDNRSSDDYENADDVIDSDRDGDADNNKNSNDYTDSNSLAYIGSEDVQSSVEKNDIESHVSKVFWFPDNPIGCHRS